MRRRLPGLVNEMMMVNVLMMMQRPAVQRRQSPASQSAHLSLHGQV